jgi:hypothetical protein
MRTLRHLTHIVRIPDSTAAAPGVNRLAFPSRGPIDAVRLANQVTLTGSRRHFAYIKSA